MGYVFEVANAITWTAEGREPESRPAVVREKAGWAQSEVGTWQKNETSHAGSRPRMDLGLKETVKTKERAVFQCIC